MYMKKILIFFACIYFSNITLAQRFEWYQTLSPNGSFNSLLNWPQNTLTSIKNKVVLSSRTCSKNLAVEGFSQPILIGSDNNSDAYFIDFDEQGNILNSQIIYTTNGVDGLVNLHYNDYDDFVYCSITTSSDSIRFNNNMPWLKINKKNQNTYNSFIAIYDNKYNYVTNIPFITYNGCNVIINGIDNAGNIFISGGYRDSLIYNGKLILKAKSIYEEKFLLKLDYKHDIVWTTDLGISGGIRQYVNESRNSCYSSITVEKNKRYVIYYKYDSLVFAPNSNNRNIIAEFASATGIIKQYTTIYTDNGLNLTEIKGNDKTLIVNSYFGTRGNNKLRISSDSFLFLNGKYGNGLIIGLNSVDLKSKFVNFFDSLNAANLKITNVYNDSIFSILGTSLGNQKFGFRGEAIYTKDYLKSRPVNWVSDFVVTYSTSNRLKDLWYFSTSNTNSYPSFTTQGDQYSILADNGNIYISSTIPFHSELGLGRREFNYSSGNNRSITLLKYNCKPTSYFSYTSSDTKINFKNLSTGLCNYTWQFGINNSSSTNKDVSYTYPKSGGTFYPKLIVSNSCGIDTFSLEINITPSSATGLDKFSFNIYPNPTSGKLSVQFENEKKPLFFSVVDLSGKSMRFSVVRTDETYYELDVQTLPNGIYFLSIEGEKNNVVKKIVVLK